MRLAGWSHFLFLNANSTAISKMVLKKEIKDRFILVVPASAQRQRRSENQSRDYHRISATNSENQFTVGVHYGNRLGHHWRSSDEMSTGKADDDGENGGLWR